MMSKLLSDIAGLAFAGAVLGSIILFPQMWVKWGIRVGIFFLVFAIGFSYLENNRED